MRRSAAKPRRLAGAPVGQARGLIRRDFPADVLADQLGAMGDGWALMYPLEPERFGGGRMRHLVDTAAALLAPPAGAA